MLKSWQKQKVNTRKTNNLEAFELIGQKVEIRIAFGNCVAYVNGKLDYTTQFVIPGHIVFLPSDITWVDKDQKLIHLGG